MSKHRKHGEASDDKAQTVEQLGTDAAAFDRLYRERIEPELAAREAKRQSGVRDYWRIIWIGGAIVVVCIALALANSNPLIAFVFAILGYHAVSYFAYFSLSFVYTDVKESTLSVIANAIGCDYAADEFGTPEIERMRSQGLLPAFDQASYEDCFAGERLKCGFYLFEAKLEARRSSGKSAHYIPVFEGQILRVAFPKKFLGTTVVRRDHGMFNVADRFGTALQRVRLVDPKFERDFEVYASDQVEARELIHPVFMEHLLALETHFNGSNLCCAFQDGDLLLAVEGPNRFEIGSMFEPLANPDRVRGVLNDIAEVMRLIDSMLTAETAPLIAIGNKDVPSDA